MPGIFQLRELEAKRRALAAENDVYRESLKLQVQNLRLYAAGMKQRASLATAGPLARFMPLLRTFLASPLSRLLVSKRRTRWLRLVTSAWTGWQFYRRFSPLLGGLFSRKAQPEETAPAAPEDRIPAADN